MFRACRGLRKRFAGTPSQAEEVEKRLTGGKRFTHNSAPHAPVAQLDRVPGYEPGGREFESLRARQLQDVEVVACGSLPGCGAGHRLAGRTAKMFGVLVYGLTGQYVTRSI